MIRDISDRLITELILHLKKLEKRIMDMIKNFDFANDELVLDLGALQAIREMGGEDGDFVLNNIIQMYLETTPSYLQQIETAIATSDPDIL
jgi:hypothetical protein